MSSVAVPALAERPRTAVDETGFQILPRARRRSKPSHTVQSSTVLLFMGRMTPCPRRDPCPGVDIALVGGAPAPLPGLHHVRTGRGSRWSRSRPSERATGRPSPAAGTTIVIVSHDDLPREVADRPLALARRRPLPDPALARDLNCGMLIDSTSLWRRSRSTVSVSPSARYEPEPEQPPSAGSASDYPRQGQATVLR
jgi:hypothetical protein